MKRSKPYLILMTFAGIVILYHVFAYIGHYGYDDLLYAKLAKDFMHGKIDFDNHFSFRTPIIALTALSYSVFGISDYASALPSMLVSCSILCLVFALLKEKGNTTLTIGLALTAASNWFIFYSDKLMPDSYVAFAFFAALYVIHQQRYHKQNRSPFWSAFLLSLALLFGFMSKGTIVLIVPLLLYYFLSDIVQKQHIRFWLYTAGIGLLMLLLYFFTIWWLTGDFFKRFESIASNSYLNLCSYDQQSLQVLLRRITYDFFWMFIYQGMAVGFLFVISYLLKAKSPDFLKMKDSFSFWITSSLLLLLSSNFMSISFTAYSPMCIDPRHYLFLIPVLAVPGAIVAGKFFKTKDNAWSLVVTFGLMAVLTLFLDTNSFQLLYLPLFLIVALRMFFKNSKFVTSVFVVFFCLGLFLTPLSMARYAERIDYREQKKVFLEQTTNVKDSLVIITNDVQKRLGNYYRHYSDSGMISMLSYDEFEYDSTDTRRQVLFMNWYTRYLSGMGENDLPYYAKNVSSENHLLYRNERLNIAVYEMKDFTVPDRQGVLIYSSLNDFESDMAHWSRNEDLISKEIVHNGEHSAELLQFSANFSYPIDSLDSGVFNQLIIRTRVFCNFRDKTTAKLVISVENEEGAYIWNGLRINEYLKAFSHWWPVSFEITVDANELKANSRINVYLLNEDMQKGYVDDFQVELFGIKE